MTGDTIDCDVLIVGGGLVGSALAAALADLPLRTVLVETQDPGRLEQPSFDSRVTALARGSQRILQGLGLWEALRRDAEPILSIHISERERFGAARIRAEEEGVPALGYTIENRCLGEALWGRVSAAAGCTVLAPARMQHFAADATGVTAHIQNGNSPRKSEGAQGGPQQASPGQDESSLIKVRAKLLVAADGARSSVRRALGIAMREDPYPQQAIIVNCATQAPHRGTAFERFMPSGPLAMLPLTRSRVGVVWSLPAEEAAGVAALPDEPFRCALQRAFGYRLGRIERVGERILHPLSRIRSDALGTDRVVLIGNAAVSLHPVAGQGYNLALRDVAALAEIVADAAREGWSSAASASIVQRYRGWRADDQRKVAWFTHGLVGLFGQASPVLGAARGLGLITFDLLPGAKSALARHTMGVAGRLPRIARGLSLR